MEAQAIIKKIFAKKTKYILLAILGAEVLSALSFLLPQTGKNITFLVVSLAVLGISLYKLEYGIWLALTELFIGSLGYLFFLDFSGTKISIRIAIWLIILAVWLSKKIIKMLREKSFPELKLRKSSFFAYFTVLFLFILWGIISGYLNHNKFNNIIFDFNGLAYFALIFPVYDVLLKNSKEKPIWIFLQIFTASVIWLCLKSLFLLYTFSHNLESLNIYLYDWVRTTRVGEITKMPGDLYRIFFQSHIFVIIAVFLFIILALNLKNKKSFLNLSKNTQKTLIIIIIFISILVTAVFISFSRSFWLGSVLAGFLFLFYLIFKKDKLKIFDYLKIIIISSLLSVFFMTVVVKFPFPDSSANINPNKAISDRAKQVKNESAVSSRWNLLPKLWEKIKSQPIQGSGFGTLITYRSSDPRITQSNPDNLYTTYAFEWGWLDLWLKLGLLGLMSYMLLLSKIIHKGLTISMKNYTWLNLSLVIGLMVVIIVNFFTPYLNHPLGIGYLIFTAVLLDKMTRLSTVCQ